MRTPGLFSVSQKGEHPALCQSKGQRTRSPENSRYSRWRRKAAELLPGRPCWLRQWPRIRLQAWDPGSTPGLGRAPGEGKCDPLQHSLCFPAGSDSKESTCNAVNLGLIPGLGRSPGEGNGYPLQYSCLENSRDRGAWRATVHGVAKSGTQLSN